MCRGYGLTTVLLLVVAFTPKDKMCVKAQAIHYNIDYFKVYSSNTSDHYTETYDTYFIEIPSNSSWQSYSSMVFVGEELAHKSETN